ncbi:MAG: DUF2182 domain-containing protein [Alphaproteobacteria bacterium]|nr:DUF2182 domain-containing protein [Alphaproteobacteria bacterium]
MSRALELLLRHDRRIIIIGLSSVVIASVLFTIFGIGMPQSALEMTDMAVPVLMITAPWTPSYFVLIFLMWWVMMTAMMLPSAAPTILLFAALDRCPKNREENRNETGQDNRKYVIVKPVLFLIGYLTIWAVFSFFATLLQWTLELRSLVSPTTMMVTSGYLGAGILLAAGLYQFSPLKRACLRQCRNPVHFLTERKRHSALLMGAEHGTFCLGCCWILMTLLFFGGIMNLYWIAGLALFILFEKLVPHGHWIGYAGGILLITAGGYILIA